MGEQVKILLLFACFTFATALAYAGSATDSPLEYIVAPRGKIVYYIMATPGTDATGNPNMAIKEGLDENRSFRILLTSRPSDDPKENLTGFSHLTLSPDGKILYFQTDAWATSNAIHAINLSTGKVFYVTSGALACIVLSGQYQSDLVVEQHRYFVQGGSHDDLWLFDPSGKQIGLVAQGTDASRVCPELKPAVRSR